MEYLKAMYMFCILIIFYFFFRLNRYERFLLEYREERDRKYQKLVQAIRQVGGSELLKDEVVLDTDEEKKS